MKYSAYFFIGISTILFFVTGCNRTPASDENIISVSIEPQRYFLEALVGDKYQVHTAIPLGSNPETYDPSPAQMVDIGKSRLYFKIGKLGFENSWLKNIQANNPAMQIADCSAGIHIIEDEGHHGTDPHIWSSPKTALLVTKNMYNELVRFDKKNEDYYLGRYREVEKNILQTDSIIRKYLADSPGKAFVIYHPSLSYFANEYALKQYSIETHGKSPSARQIADLIGQAKKDNVKVVFIQEEFDKKNAETIAEELDAEVVTINPLAYDWHEEMIKIAKAIARNDGK